MEMKVPMRSPRVPEHDRAPRGRRIPLVLFLALLLGAIPGISRATANPVAEDPTASISIPAAPDSGTRAEDALGSFPSGIPTDIEEMMALEAKVREVADATIPATVAVRVGANQGSGVIVSSDGLVLTAAHVIGRAKRRATIYLADGTRLRGTTLGLNHYMDSGMIQITTEGEYPYAELSDPRLYERGEWVVALGHRGGYDAGEGGPPALRIGRIQESRRQWLRTDCTIINGDSGGPLFDLEGKVIGIHSRIQWSVSQNYHVPARSFRLGWDRLLAGDTWGDSEEDFPLLGVEGGSHTEDDGTRGYLVDKLTRGGAAEAGGILPDDFIIGINGEYLRSQTHLRNALSEFEGGAEIRVQLIRDGKPREVQMSLLDS